MVYDTRFELGKHTRLAPEVDVHGSSVRGAKRPNNQDQYLIGDLARALEVRQTTLQTDLRRGVTDVRRDLLLMVADGMGGAPAGDRASALAVEAVARYVLSAAPPDGGAGSEAALRRSLEVAQGVIESNVAAHPERLGMGTTLTLALVTWPMATIVHAGDSRCYVLRDGQLSQLTRDHTLANVMEQRETPFPLTIPAGSRLRHLMWNVLGGDTAALEPEASRIDLRTDDTLLLCTDGLTNAVGHEELTRLLRGAGSAREACERLTRAAQEAGGKDDITIVVARLPEPETRVN